MSPLLRSCLSARRRSRRLGRGLAAVLLALPAIAQGADTIEVWEPGAYGVEMHLGVTHSHHHGGKPELTNEFLVGRGMNARLSTYVGACVTPEAGSSAWDLCMGLMGNLLDRDHFDIDVVLDASIGGEAWDSYGLLPLVEFNFDRDPQMGSWGLYLRTRLPLWQVRTADAEGGRTWSRGFDLGLNPGAYWTLSDRHQLLIEYDIAYEVSRNDPRATDQGRFALGLGTVVDERFEIVSRIEIAVPEQDESPDLSFGFGLIGTLVGTP
jgi:hypothetical protein